MFISFSTSLPPLPTASPKLRLEKKPEDKHLLSSYCPFRAHCVWNLHIQNTSILGHMAWLWGDQSYLVFGVIIARAILVVWCYSAPSNTLSHTFQPFLFLCFLSFFFFFFFAFQGPCLLAKRLFIYFTVLAQMPTNQVLILATGITWKAVFSFVSEMGRLSWAKPHLWRSGFFA